MIDNLTLRFGSGPGENPLSISPGAITIFVGPNNSGKSRLLREIQHYCTHGQKHPIPLLLESLQFSTLSSGEVENILKQMVLSPRANENVPYGHVIFGKNNYRIMVPRDRLEDILLNNQINLAKFCELYVGPKMYVIQGSSRTDLVKQEDAGDLLQDPMTHLDILFRDNTKRQKVREIVLDATGLYFVIDPTSLGNLRIRLSSVPPSEESEERGIDDRAVAFHRKSLEISDVGDGFKSFTGIVYRLIAGESELVLIDEPEAFLHPPLATKLGNYLGKLAAESRLQLILSTHSSRFLMGCVNSEAAVNIVRLTYRKNNATAKLLPYETVKSLMRLPLLRSVNVLDGLFYDYVIVTESDNDRVFYQEVNERLLSLNSEIGITNCLFLNAQNKHTIPKIVKPLRQLGVNAIALVDIDVIYNERTIFSDFLDACQFSVSDKLLLERLRANVYSSFRSDNAKMKELGIHALSPTEKKEAIAFFDILAKNGLFVVPVGELECWVPQFGIRGSGTKWTHDVLEKLGEDPKAAATIHPQDDDVGSFVSKIAQWCLSRT
jgi:ABC-type cobalamin/Fe3+-siderophores transport system ATPase subunit